MGTRGIPVLGPVATAIGSGLLAGAAGTAALTASMNYQKKKEGQEGPDLFKAEAVEKVLGITTSLPEKKAFLSDLVHWTYGSVLGLARSFMVLIGCGGLVASLFHGIMTQTIAMYVIPSMTGSQTKIDPKRASIQLGHHLIYALAAGIVADLCMKERGKECR